ncbi:MAG TPA: hypothetical protein VF177_10365 [Anaerolineae bacterium]
MNTIPLIREQLKTAHDRIIDPSEQGMGEWPLGAFLLTFVLGHIRDIMGEISAIKGVQGLQGYPF